MKINNFLTNASVYMFTNIMNALVPFLLIPILVSNLSSEAYGQIGIFQSLIIGVTALTGFSVTGAASRRYFDKDSNRENLANYIGNCVFILAVSSTFIACFLLLSQNWLSKLLEIPISWLWFAVIIGIGSFMIRLRLGQWQVRKKAGRYALLQVILSAINFFVSAALVIYFSMEAEGRVWGVLFSFVGGGIASLFLLGKDNLLTLNNPSRKEMGDALSFGVPLLPHVVGGFLLTAVDRIVIGTELGLSAAGVYMLAYQISAVLMISFDALNRAVIPYLYEVLSKEDNYQEKKKVVKTTYLFFFAAILGALFLFALSFQIIDVLGGEEYNEAFSVIGFLILGQVFNGFYLSVTNYIFYVKKTWALSLVTISCGILNLILIIALIHPFGLQGVGCAFLISMFAKFTFTWFVAQRVMPMPWLSFSRK